MTAYDVVGTNIAPRFKVYIFVMLMRNPVSILYSAFWFSCTTLGYNLDTIKFIGADIFHDRITKKIAILNHCIEEGRPLDKCVYTIA